MQRADVVIAGAGIIGLTSALELATAGMRVVVFERGHAMCESSWAAAGMLAAADPENPSPLRKLAELSRSLYPEFLASVEQLSGRKINIRTTQALHGTNALPSRIEALSSEAIHTIAPGLQPGGLQFFLLDEQSLDPRDLVQALPEAVKAAGVTIFEQTSVTAIASHADSIHVQTTRGEWAAANFINACGAWASDLTTVPVMPRKGQMLLVDSPYPLTTVLRTPNIYLVPRGDGRIVIGATVEDAGYDKQVDPAAIATLHNAAAELWPPARDAHILDTWCGLRPATTDSLPVIGIDDIVSGNGAHEREQNARSWLATGHFRNGIMLAPGTARLLRQMILKEPLSIDTSDFHAGRFAALLAQ
jgi:glycine oxidase